MKIMHKVKLEVLMIVTVVLIFSCSDATAQVKELNGNWAIDNLKSDFGGLPGDIAAPKSIVVMVDNDSIAVTRNFTAKEPSKEVLKFNNTPYETLPDGSTLKLASVRNDKTSISFNWHYEMNGNEWRFDRTEKWSLSADGKILTIERITTMPDKVDKVKAVYDRQ